MSIVTIAMIMQYMGQHWLDAWVKECIDINNKILGIKHE